MTTPPPEVTALMQGVERAAEGTPYVVMPTAQGFDVSLDVVDAQWFGLFNKAGLSKVYVHHVAVPAPGTYTITDDARSVEWVAGTPRVAATAERQYGRVKELGAQKVWAFDEQGRFGVQADFRFGSEEGRDLVTGVAQQLGLELRRGGAERVGLWAAGLVGVGAVVGLVLAVVLALTGYFG
ncbi:MAG: hypothetical protein ACO1ON_00155 [Nocardioides sp.]